MQKEPWVLLDEAEYNQVWNEFDRRFKFLPDIHPNITAFHFRVKYNEYQYDFPYLLKNIDAFEEIVKKILINCIGIEDFIYVLDWQHSCYRYNPLSNLPLQKCVFVQDDRYEQGGYNAYFPDFYPNGDYFFFMAKDFSWGYLTHPWQEKCWVFGDCIMKEFREHAGEMHLTLCKE